MPSQSISLQKLCRIASRRATRSRGGALKLCSQCSRIQVRLEQGIPVSDEIVFLGPLKRIKDRQNCPLCQIVVKSLPSSDTKIEEGDLQCTLNPRHDCGETFALFFGNGASPPLKAWIRIECPPGVLNEFSSSPSPTQSLSSQDLEDAMERTRTTDAQKVRSWLQECEREHGDQCNGHDLSPEPSDMLLIDVVEEKLVDGNRVSRYVALSYVWGGWGGARVSLGSWSSFDFLRIEGAFRSSRLRLPKVLRDAMDLTRMIGERYLWCDAVCVFQESYAQKAQQVAQMDIIYRRALFTIIALTGQHGDQPLPGVRQGSRQPAILVSEAGGGVRFIARAPSVAVLAAGSVYESRAWTFQEKLLSRRCLFMTEYQAFFCCARKCFREDEDILDFPNQRTKRLNLYSHKSGLGAMLKSFNGFSLYSNLVNDYTYRSLTDPDDILNAFEGISKLLERHFGGFFIKGLPRTYFHEALLWTPQSSIQKRSDLAIDSEKPPWMPSWCWATCVGQVCYNWPTLPNLTGGGEASYKILPVVCEFIFIEPKARLLDSERNAYFDPVFQGLRVSNYESQHYRDKCSTDHEFLTHFVHFGFFFIRLTRDFLYRHVEELRHSSSGHGHPWTLAKPKIEEFLDSHAWMFAISPFTHVPSLDEFQVAIQRCQVYDSSMRGITALDLDFWPFCCSDDRQQDRDTITSPCTTCEFQKDSWPFPYIPSLATLRERLQDSTTYTSTIGPINKPAPERLCFWANTLPFNPCRLRGGQLYRNSFSASSYLTTRDGAIQCDVARLNLATNLGVPPGQEMQPATVLWDGSPEPCGIVLDNEHACISRIAGRRCHLVLLSQCWLDEEELWHNYIIVAETAGGKTMERIVVARIMPSRTRLTEMAENLRYIQIH